MENKMHSKADCNNCFLRKGEFCTQLRNDPCSDFKPLPVITPAERESWPVSLYSDFYYSKWYAGHRG